MGFLMIRITIFSLLVSSCAAAVFAAAATDSRLVEAVQRQDRSTARLLIKQGVDVNTPQDDGATALAWAAHWNDLETAALLISAGANVNLANDLGVTPLMLASKNGSAPMVEKLLRGGANALVAQPSGETVVMLAARAGSVEAVRLLLDRGADVNATTQRGQTALMWASAENHPEVVRLLVERGADLNARSSSRTPPNKNYSNRTDITAGPRPLLRENEARNPESFRDALRAKESPRPEGGFTPMLYGALSGSIEVVRTLLSAGANVNDAAPDGLTPLVLSLIKRSEPLALFLLAQGADPNANGTGYTALHVASVTGQIDAVRALVARGADLNARLEKPVTFTEAFVTGTKVSPGVGWVDITGATPFMIAARAVNVPIMKVLAEAGADPRRTADDGATAVILAAGLGKRADADIGYYTWDAARAIEAIAFSMSLGLDINASNKDGETALHAATYHAANPLIQFLVEKGANLNAVNAQKQTPLLISQGHLVCCTTFVRQVGTEELLLKLGADQTAGQRLNFGLVNFVEEKFKQGVKPSSPR